MKKYKFKKIHAFASQNSEGNPAGAVFLKPDDEINSDEMQRIARELKSFVSEVGYVRQMDEDTFDLKYYSSEREVDFCGHATIAILYDLIQSNHALMIKTHLTIRTPKGNLLVENRVPTENAVFITAPGPVFSQRRLSAENISKALRLQPDGIHPSYPLSMVNAGLETLIVPVRSLSGILALSPEPDELKWFCMENAIDIITVFTDVVMDKKNSYRTRVFAPAFGYLEDPATGSGNAALGGYLLKNNLWDGTLISIEQNQSMTNPNIVKLLAKANRNGSPQVMFGGGAITRMDGKYLLT
ncbi:MAG: PhzF family phenazine biosynthesis protein [Desulfobacteraceae bacterium]|nr:PhzF family phenazine biosynthesis protein [Desulfobacteraceae bacterium]